MGSRSSVPEAPGTPARVPLSRPTLDRRPEALVWPRSIAITGDGAPRFAEDLALALVRRGHPARTLHVELRHRPGRDVQQGRLDVHVDDLTAALRDAMRDGSPSTVIGIGLPFAACVAGAMLRVSVTSRGPSLTPSSLERSVLEACDLRLEEPRRATAEALAELIDGLTSSRHGAPLVGSATARQRGV